MGKKKPTRDKGSASAPEPDRANRRPPSRYRVGGKVPGGFRIGERVYLTAFEQSSDKEESPDRFMVTGWGEVIGVASAGEFLGKEGVRVRLEGGSEVNCGVASLNREGPPPRFPGGFLCGEQLYWCGPSLVWPDGDTLPRGGLGTVVGPAPLPRDNLGQTREGETPNGLSMQFEGNRDRISCTLAGLSRRDRTAIAPRSHRDHTEITPRSHRAFAPTHPLLLGRQPRCPAEGGTPTTPRWGRSPGGGAHPTARSS